jgi:hypothetical protein
MYCWQFYDVSHIFKDYSFRTGLWGPSELSQYYAVKDVKSAKGSLHMQGAREWRHSKTSLSSNTFIYIYINPGPGESGRVWWKYVWILQGLGRYWILALHLFHRVSWQWGYIYEDYESLSFFHLLLSVSGLSITDHYLSFYLLREFLNNLLIITCTVV